MSAYDKLKITRSAGRPTSASFIGNLFEDFFELHGDRRFADDAAILSGLATLGGKPVTVIGIEKGQDLKDKIRRNFGAPNPEGYRKALRMMKQAEKFGRPVVCLIDTSGAFCGIGAEERGQGHAIAENLMEMSTLKVPVISILVGEGGSGGALALGVADEVWMMEHAVYSVISPEGCASILWKDAKRVKEAAECLKITANDMLEMQIIEKIFPERESFDETCTDIREQLKLALARLSALPVEELLAKRYERFRKY